MKHICSIQRSIIGKDMSTETYVDKTGREFTVMKWAKFRNRFSNYPSLVSRLSLDADENISSNFDKCDRKEMMNLITVKGFATAFILKDDSLKKNRSRFDNVLGARMMMVDFDNTCSISDIMEHSWWNKVWFAYITPSYGKIQEPLVGDKRSTLPDNQLIELDKVVGKPKRNFRLVFKFSRFIAVDEMLLVMNGMRALFPMSDQSIKDAARLMFGCKNAEIVEYPEEEYELTDDDIEELVQLGKEYSEVQIKRERKHIEKYNMENGELDENTLIELLDGTHITVKQVLGTMPLGWKESCYSPFRHEKNHSAFITKFIDGGNVLVCDKGANLKKVFIAEKPLLKVFKKKPIIVSAVNPFFKNNLSISKRQDILKNIIKKLGMRNLIYAPEGFGKSYITLFLKNNNKKILFCCESNKQAETKGEEFNNLGIVQILLSKEYLYTKNTGFNVAYYSSYDPFGMPLVNKDKSIDIILNEGGLSEDEAYKIWENEYENQISLKPNVNSDIIVTTMARAEVLSDFFRTLPDDWVVIYDDPSFSQVCNLVKITDKSEKKIQEYNEYILEYNQSNIKQKPFFKPIRKSFRLSDKDTYDIKGNKKPPKTAKYYVRPGDKKLGQRFALDNKYIPVIYTTTEIMTAYFILGMDQTNTIDFDLMHGSHVTNLTLFGTKLTYAQNDGLVILLSELLKEDEDVMLIADGLGQEYNHINSKGQNGLSETHIIVELSQLHPDQALHNLHEFEYSFGENKIDNFTIQGIMLQDKMHQAIGRNSGYREKPGNYQTVVLCDPKYFNMLKNESRYSIAPWSMILDKKSGSSICSKVRIKKQELEILNFHGEKPIFVENIQNYILNTEQIFNHEKFEYVATKLLNDKKTKDRVLTSLETKIKQNMEQNQVLLSLVNKHKAKDTSS